MNKPDHHIFVCASFRSGGDNKGACSKKGSGDFLAYIENEILDRGLNAQVTSTGCMKLCEKGPVMVVYPEGFWYGEVCEETIDTMLDDLKEGRHSDVEELD
ncbi:MAG: (2Fe-2S) ferredoxin domain-containing protein [Chloroflexota bacterium]|nr:(2Fe-2S) ferredoxin domain-containing protein [Chloroflexota bacterium]